MLSEYTVVVFLLNKNDLDDSGGQTENQDQHRKKTIGKQSQKAGCCHRSRHGKHSLSEGFSVGDLVLHPCLMVIVDQVRIAPVDGKAKEEKQGSGLCSFIQNTCGCIQAGIASRGG